MYSAFYNSFIPSYYSLEDAKNIKFYFWIPENILERFSHWIAEDDIISFPNYITEDAKESKTLIIIPSIKIDYNKHCEVCEIIAHKLKWMLLYSIYSRSSWIENDDTSLEQCCFPKTPLCHSPKYLWIPRIFPHSQFAVQWIR